MVRTKPPKSSKTLFQAPKKPPVSLFGNKPSGKKPVIQQQVQTERPGRPKKSPPAKKAPPRPKKGTKAPVTKAPTKAPKGKNGKPCRGKWCRKPCWPNCETHRPKPEVQAPQFKIDASDGDTGPFPKLVSKLDFSVFRTRKIFEKFDNFR